MLRGIYSAAAGMTTQYKAINVLGNNTANVNTTGYKQSSVSLTDFGEELAKRTSDGAEVGIMPYCVVLDKETTDLTQGDFQSTGINTDIAIDGSGFFAVRSTTGELKYTRAGDFTVDAQGFLALPTGDRLLSSNGAEINVGDDNFDVSYGGTITRSDGTTANIGIFTSANQQNITKRKDGFFDINGAVGTTAVTRQGWLENSNTDVVKNTVGMMAATRNFQGCQQAYETLAETLDKLVTQIGSIK